MAWSGPQPGTSTVEPAAYLTLTTNSDLLVDVRLALVYVHLSKT